MRDTNFTFFSRFQHVVAALRRCVAGAGDVTMIRFAIILAVIALFGWLDYAVAAVRNSAVTSLIAMGEGAV